MFAFIKHCPKSRVLLYRVDGRLFSFASPQPATFSHQMAPTFSAIIDVRSPSEFELDHIPGAINLPVMSNSERHDIGLVKYLTSFCVGCSRSYFVTD